VAVLLEKLVRIEILPSRLTTSHKKEMIDHKRQKIWCSDSTINDHGKWNSEVVYCCAEGDILPVHVDQNLSEACAEKIESDKRTRRDEGEEVTVVSSSYTVIDPDTVMILSLNAVVTYPAMVTTCRSPDIAGFAVLGWHFHCCCSRLSGFNHGPVICWGC